MRRNLIVAIAALAGAGACGGGGTATATSTVSSLTGPTTTYQTLSSTAAVTSALAGAAVRSNGTTGALDVVTLTNSSTTHNTGATTINDGTYTLTDADGFDANNQLTDGTSTIAPVASVTGNYEYVTAYTQSYSAGGVNYTIPAGVVGIATAAADVSTSGSATYTGEAAGVVASGTSSFDLTNGTATVTANFGSGNVNVTTTGFTATRTGGAGTVPIDTVSVSNMSISGNTFSGGTVSTLNGGVAVSVTGANTTATASGAFFGYDAGTNFPDEVGGVIVQQGDNGLVGVGFVGD